MPYGKPDSWTHRLSQEAESGTGGSIFRTASGAISVHATILGNHRLNFTIACCDANDQDRLLRWFAFEKASR
jgi:hypothetical protein